MVNNRTMFATSWIVTAVLLFTAGSADYGGPKLETAVEVLTWVSAAGTIITITFAFRWLWRAHSADTALALVGLACSPFIIGGLLALNGTAPNYHYTSIGGLLFSGILVVITAAILLVSRAFPR